MADLQRITKTFKQLLLNPYFCCVSGLAIQFKTVLKQASMIQKTYYKTKDYCKVKFQFTPQQATTVEVLGLNGNWEEPLVLTQKKDGKFSGEINLTKGTTHQFKYRIDGNIWLNEADADGEVANEFGGINSILAIEA